MVAAGEDHAGSKESQVGKVIKTKGRINDNNNVQVEFVDLS